ncbi:hypothetical protein P879_08341, partial [Paragonimus westermani]
MSISADQLQSIQQHQREQFEQLHQRLIESLTKIPQLLSTEATSSNESASVDSIAAAISNFHHNIRRMVQTQLVEEEYEESLTDFADLILEGLRTNTKPLLDPGVESSLCEPLPLFSTCQSAANASKLLTGLSPFSCGYITSSQITLPTDSHSMKQAPTYVEQFSSGGIYNEPCDAKPLANDVSLYPTDIYTATGCIHRTCEAFVDKCSAQTSKRNRSSNSSVDDMRPQCGPVIRRLPAVALPSEPLRVMGPTPSTIQVNFLPALSNQRTRHSRIFNIASRTYKRWTAGKQSLSSWLYTRGPSPPPCIPEEDEFEVQCAEAEYKRTFEGTTPYESFFNRLSNLCGSPTQMPQSCAEILHPIEDCASSVGAESHSIYWPDVDHTVCSTSTSSITPRFLNRPASICVDGSLVGVDFIGLSRTRNCATSLSSPLVNEYLTEYCDFGWFGSGRNLFLDDQEGRSVHTINNHVCVAQC